MYLSYPHIQQITEVQQINNTDSIFISKKTWFSLSSSTMPENKVYCLKRVCEISGMSYIGKQYRTASVKRKLICWANEKQFLLHLFFSTG